MSIVFARIILRYLSGALVTYGVLGAETVDQIAVDPDVIAALGALIGVLTEGAYAIAKRKGWAT